MTALREAPDRTLTVLDAGDRRWRELVDADPSALPFHHSAWSSLLGEVYGYRPFLLGLEDPAGGLVGGIPVMEVRGPLGGRRWISLPFTDYVPPLGAPAPQLLDSARRRAGIKRFELHAELSGPGVFPGGEAVRHVLALQQDAAAVLRTFHRSQVQRNIRKAERSGVAVRRATAADDVADAFYRLHLGTRRRLGVPVQPRRFFAALWERMIEPGRGFVLLAEADGAPVAGAVFLVHGDTVIYKYGASDAGSWSLRPNHAIFWEAIRSSCEAGRRRFDFGRTDLADVSLREFKAHWGTEELPMAYATLADRAPEAGPSGRALAPIIRRSPPWVCRAIGEALYKHAA
jgi:CelD/BcsL family acetyltransferase involved in cellulose biosynthesis